MFRHTDIPRSEEIERCRLRRQIPINPYKMRDGRGIDFALRSRDLLDASLDAGTSGGCLFVQISRDCPLRDIAIVLDLRDEEYDLYC